MQLYNRTNYQDLKWPSGVPGFECDYIKPLFEFGVEPFISNLHTQVYALTTETDVFPLTVNEEEYENAHVCSPFTKYITYGKKELAFLNNTFLNMLSAIPLSAFGSLLKAGKINQVACLNNWLLSTNLYPAMEMFSVKEITELLVDAFPQHTLMFPSLNEHTNGAFMRELQNKGYQLIPVRKVFIFDDLLKDYKKCRHTQKDFALLKDAPYQIVEHDEIKETDYKRIAELYRFLYIDKYSDCNPKYTPEMIKLYHSKKLVNFQGMRGKDGVLIGMVGSIERNGVLVNPLVGYDFQLPITEGIYRMITALSMQYAMKKRLVFNMSAGASDFKAKRGGVGFVEYNAVYHRHLPFYRRLPWNVLHFFMNKIGVPLLNKNKF